MKKDIKYIKETSDFVVNGKIVKSESLTEQQKKKLKKKSKEWNLLAGNNNNDTKDVILG